MKDLASVSGTGGGTRTRAGSFALLQDDGIRGRKPRTPVFMPGGERHSCVVNGARTRKGSLPRASPPRKARYIRSGRGQWGCPGLGGIPPRAGQGFCMSSEGRGMFSLRVMDVSKSN